jgi:hypothetical protein
MKWLLEERRAQWETLRCREEVRSRRLGRQDKAGGYLCGGEGGVGSRRRRRTCQPGREATGGVLSHLSTGAVERRRGKETGVQPAGD